MTGKELADLLDAHGYDFFTGVPCSLVEALLAELDRVARGGLRPYVPAVREDVAVGLAFHLVFDNAVYGSTGNQPSPGQGGRLDGLAAAAGYARTACVATADDISGAVREALEVPGPSFILARVTTEECAAPRIPYPPEEIRDRFRRALG